MTKFWEGEKDEKKWEEFERRRRDRFRGSK